MITHQYQYAVPTVFTGDKLDQAPSQVAEQGRGRAGRRGRGGVCARPGSGGPVRPGGPRVGGGPCVGVRDGRGGEHERAQRTERAAEGSALLRTTSTRVPARRARRSSRASASKRASSVGKSRHARGGQRRLGAVSAGAAGRARSARAAAAARRTAAPPRGRVCSGAGSICPRKREGPHCTEAGGTGGRAGGWAHLRRCELDEVEGVVERLVRSPAAGRAQRGCRSLSASTHRPPPPQQLRSPTRRSECIRPISWSAEASGPSHGQP